MLPSSKIIVEASPVTVSIGTPLRVSVVVPEVITVVPTPLFAPGFTVIVVTVPPCVMV